MKVILWCVLTVALVKLTEGYDHLEEVKCMEGLQGHLKMKLCPRSSDRCCSLYFDNGTNAGSCWRELVQDSWTEPRRTPRINGVRVCCTEDYCNTETHMQENYNAASKLLESPFGNDDKKTTSCFTGNEVEIGGLHETRCPLPNNMCCSLYFDNGTEVGICWHQIVQASLMSPHRVSDYQASRVCCQSDNCNNHKFMDQHRMAGRRRNFIAEAFLGAEELDHNHGGMVFRSERIPMGNSDDSGVYDELEKDLTYEDEDENPSSLGTIKVADTMLILGLLAIATRL